MRLIRCQFETRRRYQKMTSTIYNFISFCTVHSHKVRPKSTRRWSVLRLLTKIMIEPNSFIVTSLIVMSDVSLHLFSYFCMSMLTVIPTSPHIFLFFSSVITVLIISLALLLVVIKEHLFSSLVVQPSSIRIHAVIRFQKVWPTIKCPARVKHASFVNLTMHLMPRTGLFWSIPNEVWVAE